MDVALSEKGQQALEGSIEKLSGKLESMAVKVLDDFEKRPLTTAIKAAIVVGIVRWIKKNV